MYFWYPLLYVVYFTPAYYSGASENKTEYYNWSEKSHFGEENKITVMTFLVQRELTYDLR